MLRSIRSISSPGDSGEWAPHLLRGIAGELPGEGGEIGQGREGSGTEGAVVEVDHLPIEREAVAHRLPEGLVLPIAEGGEIGERLGRRRCAGLRQEAPRRQGGQGGEPPAQQVPAIHGVSGGGSDPSAPLASRWEAISRRISANSSTESMTNRRPETRCRKRAPPTSSRTPRARLRGMRTEATSLHAA